MQYETIFWIVLWLFWWFHFVMVLVVVVDMLLFLLFFSKSYWCVSLLLFKPTCESHHSAAHNSNTVHAHSACWTVASCTWWTLLTSCATATVCHALWACVCAAAVCYGMIFADWRPLWPSAQLVNLWQLPIQFRWGSINNLQWTRKEYHKVKIYRSV